MFGSFDDLDSGTRAIQSAYLTILEKRKEKAKEKELERDISNVEKELEKAADKMDESFEEAFLAIFEENDCKIRVSPQKVAELQRKAAEYKDSLTPADMAKFMDAMSKKFTKADDGHKGIHDANGSLQEASLLGQGMSKEAKAADVEQSDREYIAQRQARLKAKAGFTKADDEHKPIHDENGSLQQEGVNEFALVGEHLKKAEDAVKSGDLGAAKTHIQNAQSVLTLSRLVDVVDSNKKDEPVRESLSEQIIGALIESVAAGVDKEFALMLIEKIEESYNMGGQSLDDDYVARQYAAGKPAQRKSARTDGKSYFLHGNEIARKNDAGEHEFSWEGWYTPTTERHLNTVLRQVAPGKSVQKSRHKSQGVERFTVKDLGE